MRNQSTFYDRFDAVVLLSAPTDVLLDRIARRTTNDYGKTPLERAMILADVAEVEPLLRKGCTHELDASRPLDEIVEDLIAIRGAPDGPSTMTSDTGPTGRLSSSGTSSQCLSDGANRGWIAEHGQVVVGFAAATILAEDDMGEIRRWQLTPALRHREHGEVRRHQGSSGSRRGRRMGRSGRTQAGVRGCMSAMIAPSSSADRVIAPSGSVTEVAPVDRTHPRRS